MRIARSGLLGFAALTVSVPPLLRRMGEAKENDVYEEELLDYEEDDDKTVDGSAGKPTGEVAKK